MYKVEVNFFKPIGKNKKGKEKFICSNKANNDWECTIRVNSPLITFHFWNFSVKMNWNISQMGYSDWRLILFIEGLIS